MSRPAVDASIPAVPFAEALRLWARVGFLSFGGAAGQIAMLHALVVEERKWLDDRRFLNALSYCTLLPGPEAQQLATYVGWLMHGVRGGLAAGLMFVLPGALAVLALSLVYVAARDVPAVEGALFGIKAAVLAIVVQAVARMGRRVGHTPALLAVMAAAFLAILLFAVPYPAIVALAALAGALAAPRAVQGLAPAAPAGGTGTAWRQAAATARTVLVWTLAWWAPVALAAALLGPDHILAQLGLFFGQLAALAFGGAYALLAWLAQAAVEHKGWLSAAEMVDGLGLAETTPGPTILVTQFVGFLAAWRSPGPFGPLTAALLGAAVTTWATFAPSFLWIFAGAPYVERLAANRRLAGAFQGVSAAVIGVILYLAVWFALHVVFGEVGTARLGPARLPVPDLARLDLKAAGLSALAFAAAFGLRLGTVALVALMAGLGVALRLAWA